MMSSLGWSVQIENDMAKKLLANERILYLYLRLCRVSFDGYIGCTLSFESVESVLTIRFWDVFKPP